MTLTALNDFLPRFNERFRVTQTPRIGSQTRGGPEVQAQGWTGQPPSRQVSAELCRAVVEVLEGLDGRQCNTKGYRRLPASASTDPAQLRHRTVHTAGPSRNGVLEVRQWAQCVVDRLRDDADRNGAARRTATPPAIQKAHPTSDGEMEGGPEGEAQGAVHPWDRPGTEHTQRHREEARKPTRQCRAAGSRPAHPRVARLSRRPETCFSSRGQRRTTRLLPQTRLGSRASRADARATCASAEWTAEWARASS